MMHHLDTLNQGLPLTIPLWEENTPLGADEENGRPQATLYLASQDFRKKTGRRHLPGGGYGMLSVPKEGHRIARFLSSQGISAAVLENRISPYRHPAPLIDAQRAIRTLRHYIAKLDEEAWQVGILGFSAGGHLAGCAATMALVEEGLVGDAIDTQSSKPEFAALIYPVISLTADCAHLGSRDNLPRQST